MAPFHEYVPDASSAIARGPSNSIMRLTATGPDFIATESGGHTRDRDLGEGVIPHGWNLHKKLALEGRSLLQSLLDIGRVIWPMLIGPNRARYFLLTGQELAVAEATQLGLVAEVPEPPDLSVRAWELARPLNEENHLVHRYSRELLTYRFKKALLEELPPGVALEGIGRAASVREARVRTSDRGGS
jgi:hypothetical protein